eukprot:119225-Pleurochrysis_carterae.AAC.3
MPDSSNTRDCPAASATMIAEGASRTHAIVELFRCVRFGVGMGACVALTLVSEERSCCRGCWYNGGTAARDVGV